MQLEDMILISVDDHLIEPPDTFRHISARFKDRAPRVTRVNGKDAWLFEGRTFKTGGLNSVAGRPKEEFGMEPTSYDEMRPGCYDIHKRIDDMNVDGVLASICFPSLVKFAGSFFHDAEDKQLSLAALRAYNDWHILDWCGAYPGRFVPLCMLPLWDVQLAVEEVKRVVAQGVHAVGFPDNPALKGLPSLHSDAWDPLFKVCADNQVVLNCHIGTGASAAHPSDDSPIDAWITAMPISIANSAADWIYAPAFQKFPGLRMALSEGGIGWIPYLLERADFTTEHHSAWTRTRLGGKKPSEVFKEHIITCFIDDEFGLRNLDSIGEDMVTWEADYPHSDCVWPLAPEYLWRTVEHLPKATIDKITHLNVMREFSFDPFNTLGRENCTVGALRSKAAHVDTAPLVGLGGAKPIGDPNARVTSRDVKRMFAAVGEHAVGATTELGA